MSRKDAKAAAIADPSAPPADPTALLAWCEARLKDVVRLARIDPLHNPVAAAAFNLAQALAEGVISLDDLAAAAKMASDRALIERAERLAAVHAPLDLAARRARLRAVFDDLATTDDADGGFERFRTVVERPRSGVVFTAHPTFALSKAMRAALARRATATTPAAKAEAEAVIAAERHAPDARLGLDDEHACALDALDAAQDALADVGRVAFEAAFEAFGDRARGLTLRLATLATWVGYDLDGRVDIGWSDAMRLRLTEKARQLARYRDAAADLAQRAPDEARLAAIADRLDQAARSAEEDAAAFAGALASDEEKVAAANRLTRADPRRLVSLKAIDAELFAVQRDAGVDRQTAVEIGVLRAEMAACGLGVAGIHLRVNAAQVRNAVRADLGVDGDVERFGRVTLERAAERAAQAGRRAVNFADVHLEQMTARRQLKLAAQILKHVDADQPIRFLIAECERPATIMATIYLARLYGVADRLDISPLFETPSALERAGRFMERLFAEPGYREYVTARGRACIQIGYSDSGRFMGQVTTGLAAERAQVLFARALEAAKLDGVGALVFCTHGESMGRGGHPGSMADRLDHLISPWARSRFARAAAPLTIETSFQGGDGYLHFATPELALASLGAFVELGLASPRVEASDPFYADIAFSWDVYRSLKAWQEAILDDPDHHALLDAFASGLLVTAGSRKAKRPRQDGPRGARALRAIPHNATLQQVGFPINVAGGLGQAVEIDPDRFVDALAASPRWRLVVDLADRGRKRLSLDVTRAYAKLFDAGVWTARASKGARAGVLDPASAALAADLVDRDTAHAIERLVNRVAPDLARFDEITARAAPPDPQTGQDLVRLKTLHILRLAVMAHGLRLAAMTPTFSPRNDVARADVVDLALQFRLSEAADIVDAAFPAVVGEARAFEAIEETGEASGDAARGYPEIRAEIVERLRRAHAMILEIGVGIAHASGAYG